MNYKVQKRVSLPPASWITVPNTHEPIIVQEEFDRAQELLSIRSYTHPVRTGGHLLTGLAYCGDCGRPMTYVREGPGRTYMVCQGYRKGGLCTSHRVREDMVIEAIGRELRSLAPLEDREQLQADLLRHKKRFASRSPGEITRQKQEHLDEMLERLYRDRVEGILSCEEFHTLLWRNREERARWQAQAQASPAAAERPPGGPLPQLQQLLSFQEPDRGAVASLLQRVLVHENKRVELILHTGPDQQMNEP